MKRRVLLIDSARLVCERLRKKLEGQDYDVGWARDGQDAVHDADLRQTDLLLIDLDVPPAESREILSRMAELNPFLRVLGLTERPVLQAATFGTWLSAVVGKPIDEDGLLLVMEELLMRVPNERGVFRLVPRRAANLQEVVSRWPAERNIYPAAYSRWGINE
jgi:DNA-binding response OmpR family regulator